MSQPQYPVVIADQQVGVNDAIAAALTRWVGSMPALYVVLTIFGGWMSLATWGPLHRADPYPFLFLLFLNNVAQLILCLVILVGQRVLGVAADRRAVQTYENAEAIFAQVADLQAHLDRHDQALSRGVSLLESSPHPWIQRHRVQSPPQALDEAAGVNDRIAAWLTQRLGSVWAFYVAAGSQAAWIILAQTGVQRFDRYPFEFMTFLSTLGQLIFMIVIMVGQDVLGRAGDRRSEQTFLDAEAILYECRRMKARLTAQDRIIDSLTGYTTTTVAEQLARVIHSDERPWEDLPEEVKEANRARARRIGEDLAAIGCLMVPTFDPALIVGFEDDEVQVFARLQHEHQNPDQVAWEQLPDEARSKSMDAARRIPALLARAGFQVLRDARDAHDGPTESDFASAEWETLQRAMMASGVLVAIAEGVVDAEEMFALIKKLREASITHPKRFIRELAASSTFETGLRADTSYADYQGPALEVIRSATAIVAEKAPTELPEFRILLTEIAETVADANLEGGFYGLGARRRYGNEAVAMAAVSRAAGLEDLGPSN